MSENDGIRIVSLFVGVLLCTALMQTACAAWNIGNWNQNAGNITEWNATTANRTIENTTWDSMDGSLPSADLINTPVQSPDFVNAHKFYDRVSDSISKNGMQFPRIQRR